MKVHTRNVDTHFVFDQAQNESSLEPDAYEKDANWFNGSNTTVHAEKRDL